MSETAKPQYTAEQIAEAARILEDTFDPETGRHPKELFFATSQTVPRTTVELAVYSPDKQQVLLTERDSDDPHFTSMWHLPGVMMVTADITNPQFSRDPVENAAVRARLELAKTCLTEPLRLSPDWVHQPPRQGPRGIEIPELYCAHIMSEEPEEGEMFDVDDLPKNTYEHHPYLIKAAQEAFNPAHAAHIMG